MPRTDLYCDGCGRNPTVWEWVRAELTTAGYQDWRHPGIVFRALGCPIDYDNRARCERLFEALFGRALPEEAGFLCPRCQERAAEELPVLIAQDTGDDRHYGPRHRLG